MRLHVATQGPTKLPAEDATPSASPAASAPTVASATPRRAPLLLFVHGFGGGYFDFEPLFDQLASHPCRLAAVDLRGYGRSDKTPRGYDLTTAASDIAGVIRGLGYADATVIGHGYGGMVGWTLAAHEPERVRHLVTLSSAHPIEQTRHIVTRPLTQWKRARSSLFAQLPRLPERQLTRDNAAAAEALFRQGVAPGFRDTDPYRTFAAARREAMQVDKVAHLASEYRRWLFRSRFRPEGRIFDRSFPKRTAAPVLAIDGSMDPDYSPVLTKRSVARGGEGSHAKLIYGVGHYPHIEDPEVVADLIRTVL